MVARSSRVVGAWVWLGLAATALSGQRSATPTAEVRGRVVDATTLDPIRGALVSLEGGRPVLTDSVGRFLLLAAPAGPQVIVARRIGFTPTRYPVTVPTSGTITVELVLARRALELPGVIVTATPEARARGETGTASVVDRDAISTQVAASIAGILELTPGVLLSAPGLDGVQQIGLRAVPTSGGGSVLGGSSGPSAADLASFGTLIVVDGVPLSNNANLQTGGPRAELATPSSAGGGVDLRRIPAATLQRVEVIRGIPSARYGDLTNGAIVVDTRAGVVEPEVAGRYDYQTSAATIVGGSSLGAQQVGTASLEATRTLLTPGLLTDDAVRVSAQLQHRLLLGGAPGPEGTEPRIAVDSRLDFYRLFQDNPEQPIFPGHATFAHDQGLRVSERARLALPGAASITLTFALDRTSQHSYRQDSLIRAAMPFTDRLTAGRDTGKFILGPYLARLRLDGVPWLLYGRLEGEVARAALGLDHHLRLGAELRREWNAGPGYQFDIEFPPQVAFNGVQGFDRPRRFDAVPAVATSAFYLDDRMLRPLGDRASFEIQAGLRVDLRHWGTDWLHVPRDVAWQPRFNAQLAPRSWLRLRAGAGRTAKLPALAQLYPARQYFDVVNVNWYAPDPAERLAILTTTVRDPTNTRLRYSIGKKIEAGIEVDLGSRGSSVSLVRFRDAISGGVGLRALPGFLIREHFDLTDSTVGTGSPPGIIEPAASLDSVPILVDQPSNNLDLTDRGWELTASLPEVRSLHSQLEVQAVTIATRLDQGGPDFGLHFSDFQQTGSLLRAPYWDGVTREGRRAVITTRLVHRRPEVGLVITLTTQFLVHESTNDVGATDSLAFAGFITRDGVLVPVPPALRGDPQYADLRIPRLGVATSRRNLPDDWILSLQVSKTLPLGGRLSCFAFNAFDRPGRIDASGAARSFQPVRFGLEITMPVRAVWGSAH